MQYPWLHYDFEKDAAFCHLCMKASVEGKFLTSSKRDPAFISKGFTYWKEDISAFKKHQISATHREATEAVVTLPKEILGDIEEVISSAQKKKRKRRKQKGLLTYFAEIVFPCTPRHAFKTP